jgi:hypothetical protein
MDPHLTGSFYDEESQFLFKVDSHTAVLDAAAYADANNLWVNNRAKVFVTNGPVGVTGIKGELTSWINLYRKDSGALHGSPGNAP